MEDRRVELRFLIYFAWFTLIFLSASEQPCSEHGCKQARPPGDVNTVPMAQPPSSVRPIFSRALTEYKRGFDGTRFMKTVTNLFSDSDDEGPSVISEYDTFDGLPDPGSSLEHPKRSWSEYLHETWEVSSDDDLSEPLWKKPRLPTPFFDELVSKGWPYYLLDQKYDLFCDEDDEGMNEENFVSQDMVEEKSPVVTVTKLPDDIFAVFLQHLDSSSMRSFLSTCKHMHGLGSQSGILDFAKTTMLKYLEDAQPPFAALDRLRPLVVRQMALTIENNQQAKADDAMLRMMAYFMAVKPHLRFPPKLIRAVMNLPFEQCLVFQEMFVNSLVFASDAVRVTPLVTIPEPMSIKFTMKPIDADLVPRLYLPLISSGTPIAGLLALYHIFEGQHEADKPRIHQALMQSPFIRYRILRILNHVFLGMVLVNLNVITVSPEFNRIQVRDRLFAMATFLFGALGSSILPLETPPMLVSKFQESFNGLGVLKNVLSGIVPGYQVGSFVTPLLTHYKFEDVVLLTNELLGQFGDRLSLGSVSATLPFLFPDHQVPKALKEDVDRVVNLYNQLTLGLPWEYEPALWQRYFLKSINGYNWADGKTLEGIWVKCASPETSSAIIESMVKDLYWDHFYPLDMLNLIITNLGMIDDLNDQTPSIYGPKRTLASYFPTANSFYFFLLLLTKSAKELVAPLHVENAPFRLIAMAAAQRGLGMINTNRPEESEVLEKIRTASMELMTVLLRRLASQF